MPKHDYVLLFSINSKVITPNLNNNNEDHSPAPKDISKCTPPDTKLFEVFRELGALVRFIDYHQY
jgi:hypothetical protein